MSYDNIPEHCFLCYPLFYLSYLNFAIYEEIVLSIVRLQYLVRIRPAFVLHAYTLYGLASRIGLIPSG